MLFFSFFKTLVDHEVTVELKNDIQIKGTLKSVDQYLNIKLDDIQVVEELKYPHLVSFSPRRKRLSAMFMEYNKDFVADNGSFSLRSRMFSSEGAWLDMCIYLEVR
ncbi:U6 snRNA-associated Sm-like protein LSm2 [Lachnellula arida]|uniref:U6 snRNA-associated Sm-like protein LSm2 n=1 Tax=Lachnellula arida TaxID=1316785 RepID=A0A8T9BI35_9HELO|nr:U6 snRNA-associated Sm-like protein LSm2 [Lachnellula arida]